MAVPPPPDRPELPPRVRVGDEVPVTFANLAGDGVLEGMLAPRDGGRALVVCHPHPRYGGTMDNAVVVALCKAAGARGYATLRWNYRGVGASTGRYDEGRGEADDVRAALRYVRATAPGAAVDVVGYSFGSYVALAAAGEGVRALALVAPVPSLFDYRALGRVSAPVTVTLGDRDAFCAVDEARALADDLDAALTVVTGADHFFVASRGPLADTVLRGLARPP